MSRRSRLLMTRTSVRRLSWPRVKAVARHAHAAMSAFSDLCLSPRMTVKRGPPCARRFGPFRPASGSGCGADLPVADVLTERLVVEVGRCPMPEPTASGGLIPEDHPGVTATFALYAEHVQTAPAQPTLRLNLVVESTDGPVR